MIGDDVKKDEALLEVYATYDYMAEESLKIWKNLTQDELTYFCLRFDDLNRNISFLDKSQALVNIVSYLSSLFRILPSKRLQQ